MKITEEKGITLIALIITIIILIILVGVTVNVAISSGLFKTTQKAKSKTESALVVENVSTIVATERANNLDFTATEMRQQLIEKGIVKEDGKTINTESFIGRQDDNYLISADGTIRYWGEKIGYVDLGLTSREIQVPFPKEEGWSDPVFEELNLNLNVKVLEGEIEYTKGNNYIVVIAPTTREDGKKFSHWEDDYGNIVSYTATSSFNVLSDITYTPIYVQSDTLVEKDNIFIINQVITSVLNKCAFSITKSFLSGNTLVEGGVLLTKDNELATEENFTIEKLNELNDESKMRKLGTLTTTNNRIVFFHFGLLSASDRYIRAYMKYTDSNGEEHVIYTNIIKTSAENQKVTKSGEETQSLEISEEILLSE